MSAYSDWKVGALTDAEYRQEMEYEARRAAYEEERIMDEIFWDEWGDYDE